MKQIIMPEIIFSGKNLVGKEVIHSARTLGEIRSIFEHGDRITPEDMNMTAYTVSSYLPEKEGTPGGLYFGLTSLYPGLVGDEYFMTKGHFHANMDTAEFYWGIEGEGVLILMDEQGNITGERMFPGSLHYIAGRMAHRAANVSDATLSFGACWLSNAGHDYASIEKNGFAARLKKINGTPQFV
jgi:glucose-6-phosphate isomerase